MIKKIIIVTLITIMASMTCVAEDISTDIDPGTIWSGLYVGGVDIVSGSYTLTCPEDTESIYYYKYEDVEKYLKGAKSIEMDYITSGDSALLDVADDAVIIIHGTGILTPFMKEPFDTEQFNISDAISVPKGKYTTDILNPGGYIFSSSSDEEEWAYLNFTKDASSTEYYVGIIEDEPFYYGIYDERIVSTSTTMDIRHVKMPWMPNYDTPE